MESKKLRIQANKKGFTLMELIIVIAILAVLSSLLIPSMLGYIQKSQAVVCDTNRKVIEQQQSFISALLLSDVTIDDLLANKYPEYTGEKIADGCPAGGEYSAAADGVHVLCSIHGGEGEPGGGETGGTIPGTNIPVSGDGWPVEMSDDGRYYYFRPSGIFEYNGKYYVISRSEDVWHQRIDDGPASGTMLSSYVTHEIRGIYNEEPVNGKYPTITRGDVVEYEGDFYVFVTGGSYGSAPPQEGAHGWYKLPK
ncbi:MAG: prepilin-type N-terminal cleavage/methylation domain-containing protein [Christensenellaceae bacterium]